ncbi:MAG: 2-succinyl-5-enolpyruvyl-6-hydroxy-3-cyclohexene-1-carboxylic-acid synthase, partial [Saprospiraceae bacterium]|nr:2-succinyl-5-enolpyruvyl-6-hydroxy-3-cyclohexene-1-carboxylic-acid synthase [Saprospiraceae bacterium]
MTSDKTSIARLVEIAWQKGITDVVFSPGSRNAPIIIAFVESEKFNCICIPDERVAAFYAMGISLKTQRPTIICCTSGSAALNYAPAICEAFYQYIPLLIITADRPIEWIDQGIGQSIRQNNIYNNYVKGAFQYIQDARGDDDIWYNDRILNEAINLSLKHNLGPVHLNIPFREPLYGTTEELPTDVKIIKAYDHRASLSGESWNELSDIWRASERKIVLLGLSHPSEALTKVLNILVKDKSIILLTENCSNVYVEEGIQCIDRVITTFENPEEFKADLVLTIGGPVISKKIKKFFQTHKAKYHWDLRSEKGLDTFQTLTHKIDAEPIYFLDKLVALNSLNNIKFQDLWLVRNEKLKALQSDFMNKVAFSDLKVFDIVMNHLPNDCILHLSNSAIVRYAQLFDQKPDVKYFSNRGVSGIDGSTSTALGYATKSDKQNILISGDMSFFYDSNAFWNHHLPENFKIVLINNSGGGIFRIIPGPSQTKQLDQYFEASHETNAESFAKMYDMKYQSAASVEELND